MEAPSDITETSVPPPIKKRGLAQRLPFVAKLGAAIGGVVGLASCDLPDIIPSDAKALELEKRPGIAAVTVTPASEVSPTAQPTVKPSPEATRTITAQSPETKAARARIQENLFDLEDVLGIPGAAAEYSKNPEKSEFDSFTVLNDAKGNPAFIFVTKGTCGMEVEINKGKPEKDIRQAIDIINEVDPDIITKFAQQYGIAAIAFNVLPPESAPHPGEQPEFFSQENGRAGWLASFVLNRGKVAVGDPKKDPAILLINKYQLENAPAAVGHIITEAEGINGLRHLVPVKQGGQQVLLLPEEGFFSRDLGQHKTLGAEAWLKKNEKQMEASPDPIIQDVPVVFGKNLKGDRKYYGLPVQN